MADKVLNTSMTTTNVNSQQGFIMRTVDSSAGFIPVRDAKKHPWLRPFTRRIKNAFTLMELLIVISVIGLLMGILLPALNRARQQARKMICRSNMRQMGIVLRVYLIDNEYRLPPSSCREKNPHEYWLYILNNYVKESLLFRCPADKAKNFLDWQNLPEDDWGKYRWSSYASNGFFDNPVYSSYQTITRIRRPDQCIFVCELQSGTSNNGVDHVHADMWESPTALQAQVAWNQHRDTSNYLFVDGHADSYPWDKTWYYPDPAINLWNPQTAPGWPKLND